MMTTAGNGPGPSGFVIVAGTPSALGAGAVVDEGAPLAHAVIVAARASVATNRAQAAAGECTPVARE
jgi:hypothetical protein